MQAMKQWKYCWYLEFFIIFGLLIVKFMFYSNLERKNDKVSTFNIVHFLTLKKVSLELAPYLTVPKCNKCQGHLLEEMWYELCNWCFSWNFPKIFRTAMSKSNHIFMQRVLLKKQWITQDLIRSTISLVIHNTCKFKTF